MGGATDRERQHRDGERCERVSPSAVGSAHASVRFHINKLPNNRKVDAFGTLLPRLYNIFMFVGLIYLLCLIWQNTFHTCS